MTTTATWFHCQAKPISRGKGRQAVAAAAYRLGLCLHDNKYDLDRDYTRRGGVVTGFTLAPEGAPAWVTDPAQLWNAVEAKENRKNSQLALEWEVALPNEFDDAKREALARRFSQWLVDQYGVAVSIGIHRDGQRPNGPNDHMHVMMTTRPIDAAGWSKNKLRDFNCRPGQPNPVIEHVRVQMAAFINEALENAGSDQRVTHLSYEARGIDRMPTDHLGPSASEMERREPGSSDRGERNREIEERNALVAELAALDAEITEAGEQRLDGLYGPAEPEEKATPPATPQQAAMASFEAAMRPAIDALDALFEPAEHPEAIGLPEPMPQDPADTPFDAAMRPAIASLGDTAGEASSGSARRWQRMMEVYRHGTDRLATFGREAIGSWQRYVRRTTHRGRDGPQR